jgi:hypothetical protein
VEELNARLHDLETELHKLRSQRNQLNLPELDRTVITSLIDNLENVMASGTNPKEAPSPPFSEEGARSDRGTVEVWYGLPY